MYDAVADPYCYPQTTVLKNRAGLRTQRALTRFETAMAAQRADEPLPSGRLSVRHYRAIHRHLFQDVYEWAGERAHMFLAAMIASFHGEEKLLREGAAAVARFRGIPPLRAALPASQSGTGGSGGFSLHQKQTGENA